MKVITEEQIRTAAREVFDEVGPDFTYGDVVPGWCRGRACKYTISIDDADEVPACIVGRILHKVGVDVSILMECEDQGVTDLYLDLEVSHDILLPRSILPKMREAQATQDDGVAWHQALVESGLVVLPEEENILAVGA